MKTQCPHCQAKFKSPDEHKGKKVKCPKCKQPFVITQFVETTSVQLCARCNKRIQKPEQARVWHGVLVCSECDQKLPETPVTSSKYTRETEWLPLRQASKTGLIVAIIILVIGILSVVTSPPKETSSMRADRIAEITNKTQFLGGILTWSLGALFLIIRSFRPGIGSWRGLLTFAGGFMLGLVIAGAAAILTIIASSGPGDPAAVFGAFLALLLFLALAIALLIYGFRPKKSFASAQVKRKS